jgi:hypothetical protein
MTSGPTGGPEPTSKPGGDVPAGIKRAMNFALGHLVARRLGLPIPVHAAELTAIRSAVEDKFDEATAGITAVDVDGGWTAAESLEQYGLRVAMDMMVEDVLSPTNVVPTMPRPQPDYRVVCDDNFDPESETLFVVSFASAVQAIHCAQCIVDQFLAREYKPGMTADRLYDQYTSFGEDPWIKSPDGAPRVAFSAWDYARQRCAEICRQSVQ